MGLLALGHVLHRHPRPRHRAPLLPPRPALRPAPTQALMAAPRHLRCLHLHDRDRPVRVRRHVGERQWMELRQFLGAAAY